MRIVSQIIGGLKKLKLAPTSRADWMGFVTLLLLIAVTVIVAWSHQQDQRNISTLQQQIIDSQSAYDLLTVKYQKLEKLVTEKNSIVDDQKNVIADKDAQIQKRDATIQDLNNQIASLKSQRSVAAAPKANSGSIYDRIRVNAPFRDQIVRALKLIESAAPEYFSKINSQVAYINETSMCGGWQLTRDINIGSCDGTFPDSVVASLIVHESMHVYNVYVNRVYSMQTKEQELPSYLAERDVEARLGVPQWYRDMTTQKIAYWSQQ